MTAVYLLRLRLRTYVERDETTVLHMHDNKNTEPSTTSPSLPCRALFSCSFHQPEMSLSGLYSLNTAWEHTEHRASRMPSAPGSPKELHPQLLFLGVLYDTVRDLSTWLFDAGLFIGLDLDEAGLSCQQAQGPTCLHLTTEGTTRPDSSGQILTRIISGQVKGGSLVEHLLVCLPKAPG